MAAPWRFIRYLPAASRYIRDGRVPLLLTEVIKKSRQKRLDGAKGELMSMVALASAWWRGEYQGISRKTMLMIIAGLVYFVMPFDGIPDWVIGLGLIDDIAVLGWVARQCADELDAFKLWSRQQKDVASGSHKHDTASAALRS